MDLVPQPKLNDIVCLYVDITQIDIDEAYNIYLQVSKSFPLNMVICLPKPVTGLQYFNKEELQKIMENIFSFCKL